MKNTFVFGDPRKCIGCGACEVACAAAHIDTDIAEASRQHIDFHPRVTVVYTPEVTIPIQCRQCEDAPCANSCPEEAIVKRGGAIEVLADECVGCKSCVVACPFGAIQVVETNPDDEQLGLRVQDADGLKAKPPFKALKCDLCSGRDNGPACVEVCPAGALSIMTPDDMRELVTNRRQSVVNGLA